MVPKRAVIGLHRLANAQEAHSPVHIAKDESHLRVAFNCEFLLDLLGAVKSGDVEFALKDAESAAELRPVDHSEHQYRYVVMPMRL